VGGRISDLTGPTGVPALRWPHLQSRRYRRSANPPRSALGEGVGVRGRGGGGCMRICLVVARRSCWSWWGFGYDQSCRTVEC